MIRLALPLFWLGAGSLAAQASGLSFSSEPSDARTAAHSMLEAELGAPIPAGQVAVALIDLESDGSDEIFAIAEADGLCTTAGCVPRIYKSLPAGNWRQIAIGANESLHGRPENWTVAPQTYDGHVILTLTRPDIIASFVWNGIAYVSLDTHTAQGI